MRIILYLLMIFGYAICEVASHNTIVYQDLVISLLIFDWKWEQAQNI